MFDYMCGVSTGAVITAMLGKLTEKKKGWWNKFWLFLGAFKVDLNQCEELYKHFSSTVFQRNKALGISSLITSQSYYDTKSFENYLR
jgi:calcium-independent phospholipase A2-gamma